MAVVEDIEVVLDLDDRQYTAKIRGAADAMRVFGRSIDDINRRMGKMQKSMRGFTATVRDWSIIIGQARNVIQQLWYITGRWASALVRTSAEIERLTSLMKGMSKAAGDAGKEMEAASNVRSLFDMAQNAPFTINALSDSFVKFKSVGIDPLDGSMGSLVDAVAAFGGTDETLHRASIAIQQMAGKGVISMEELRQQLGEAVPQAITIMAQSMGMSYSALVKEISEGNVAAGPALEAMFNGFDIAFGGRAQALMDNYTGKVAKMKTAWKELVSTSEGIDGYFESVKDATDAITGLIQSDMAMGLMDGVGGVLEVIVNAFTFLTERVSVTWGQIKGFFSMINEASLNEDSLLGQLRLEIEREIGLMDKLYQQYVNLVEYVRGKTGGEAPKTVGDAILNPMGLFPQEWVDTVKDGVSGLFLGMDDSDDIGESMLRGRLISGAELAEDEVDAAIAIYDQQGDRIDAASDKLGKAVRELNENLVRNAHENPLGDQEIFSQDQVNAMQARAARIQELMDGVNEAERQVDMKIAETVQKRDSGQMWYGPAERKLAELEQRKNTLSQNYLHLFNQLEAVNNRIANIKPPEVTFDEFGDRVVQGSADRLERLAQSTDEAVRAAAQNVLDLRDKIASLEDEANSMADTVGEGLSKAAESMAEPFIEQVEEAEADMASAGSDMLKEAHDILTSSAGTAEDRFAEASEVANAFFDMQVENMTAVGAVAQAELEKQGIKGIEAAAIVAAQIVEILNSIEERRQALISGWQTNYSVKAPSTPKRSRGGGGGKSKGQRATEKLKDLIEKTNREAEKLGETLADPFSYQLPSAIDKAREKIDKLAKDMSGGKWTAEMKTLFDQMATNAVTEELIEMKEATRDIERSLMGEREARNDIYDEEVSRIADMKEKLIEMGLWRVEWEQIIQAQLKALQDELKSQSPMGEFANEWKDLFDDLEQNAADTFGNIAKEIANMVTEGEADFASLTRAAINSMLEISINAAMSGLYDWGSQLVSGWIGGMGGAKIPKTATPGVGVWHRGGIVGTPGISRAANANLFAGAPRFHTGGIVGNEVPIIAKKGEGVFTEEQMKAIGKGMSNREASSMPARVNIINETGQPIEQSEANQRMDAEGMILDVVLSASGRPGKFRESLKEVLK